MLSFLMNRFFGLFFSSFPVTRSNQILKGCDRKFVVNLQEDNDDSNKFVVPFDR
ncbi:hypothetical protein Hanom_Chr00s000001g01593031 [Helianthus anomalus]